MKTKIVIIVLITVLLVIFVLQNTENVIVNFWFWDLSLPRALLLFVTFALGLIIGLIVPSARRSSHKDREPVEE